MSGELQVCRPGAGVLRSEFCVLCSAPPNRWVDVGIDPYTGMVSSAEF